MLVYDAPEREQPGGALLWIHGGGLVLGGPEQGHDVCTRLAEEAGVFVASVEYRLAPEHPFPAGLDDCLAALRWLHGQAAVLGIDPSRIAVGGDSAGGGLAAAVCQRALDDGGPAVAFQLLEYPMLDDRTVLRTDLDPDGCTCGHLPPTATRGRPTSAASRRSTPNRPPMPCRPVARIWRGCRPPG